LRPRRPPGGRYGTEHLPGRGVRGKGTGRFGLRIHPPHTPRGEEASEIKRNPASRRGGGSWSASIRGVNRFRKLVPRYEKTDLSYCGLLNLAAAMITSTR
jgi:hypothetical protein